MVKIDVTRYYENSPVPRLSETAIRIRLDLREPSKSFAKYAVGEVHNIGDLKDSFGTIADAFCSLLVTQYAWETRLCPEEATVLVTGLLGVKPDVEMKRFSTRKYWPLSEEESRFFTFELDLKGHRKGFEDWSDG